MNGCSGDDASPGGCTGPRSPLIRSRGAKETGRWDEGREFHGVTGARRKLKVFGPRGCAPTTSDIGWDFQALP
jgi:hypothetical protein